MEGSNRALRQKQLVPLFPIFSCWAAGETVEAPVVGIAMVELSSSIRYDQRSKAKTEVDVSKR